MDDPSQDPVDLDYQTNAYNGPSNPSGEKIVKMKVKAPDATPSSATISLATLSVEDVCYLLNHSQLSAISGVARENQFSGNILATGVESAEDLKEFGIKSMFAQSLFKHILKWKEDGVPADIFAQRDAKPVPAAAPSAFTGIGATNIGAGVKLRPANKPDSAGVFFKANRPDGTFDPFLAFSTMHSSSNAANVPNQVQQTDSQRFLQQLEESRQASEKKALEIRELQAAVKALENDRHHDSGRMVLGLGGRYDCLRCCICQPDIARLKDPKPQGWFELDCQHNYDLIKKVEQLVGDSNRVNYRSFGERYSEALQRGKQRLQNLQK